ncbi:hypothetical protein PJI17_32125, partial [Mycobacterium kansasii]
VLKIPSALNIPDDLVSYKGIVFSNNIVLLGSRPEYGRGFNFKGTISHPDVMPKTNSISPAHVETDHTADFVF